MNSEYSARRHKQNENRISGPEMSACNTPVTQRMRVKYQGRSYTKYKYTAVTFDFQFQMIPICIWSCEAWIDFVPLICLAILQFRLLRANQRQIINRSMIHDGFFRTSFYMLNGRCNTFTLQRNQFENVEYFALILWQNCIDFYLPICRIRIQNAHFTAWMYSCGNAVDWEPFQCCNFLRIKVILWPIWWWWWWCHRYSNHGKKQLFHATVHRSIILFSFAKIHTWCKWNVLKSIIKWNPLGTLSGGQP